MSFLTGILYGALAIYLGGWYVGRWQGNFSFLLFVMSLVTMAYWLAERFKFQPEREAAAAHLVSQDQTRRTELSRQGINQVDGDVEQAKEPLLMQPWGRDWTAGPVPGSGSGSFEGGASAPLFPKTPFLGAH